MNKDDIAYAAGLFDAEGHVSITKSKRKHCISPHYELSINLTSTNWPILNWFKNNFGGCISRDKRKRKPCFQWTTSTNVAANFLQKIIPDLQIKKLQVRLALQFQAEIRKNYKHCRITLESLQHREQFRNQIFIFNHQHSGTELADECKIPYVAGLFDGDGSISIARESRKKSCSHTLRIKLSSNSFEIVSWMQNNFNGSTRTDEYKIDAFPNSAWRTSSNLAENFLRQIFPRLRLKKPNAELALQFQNEKKRNNSRRPLTLESLERREQLRQQMLALNRGS